MGLQENVNRTIGSLSKLLGIMKIKESLDPEKLLSSDTTQQIKNFSEAQNKVLRGEARISRKNMNKLKQYTADLEKKV
jgi:hypothetical protein